MPYVEFVCLVCGDKCVRHHNAKKCLCGGGLVLASSVCPTRGKRVTTTPRVCGRCKKPIKKGHKWYVAGSTIYHRVCERPDYYT